MPMAAGIMAILERHLCDRTRLLDILWDIQHAYGHIPAEVLPQVARTLGTTALDISETASFYHFFCTEPSATHRIYLSNTVVAKMGEFEAVYAALEEHTGARFEHNDDRALFALLQTPCIGLSDQEPAMLIDEVVFTRLTPEKVAHIVAQLRDGRSPAAIANPEGLPSDDLAYVEALVESTVCTSLPVFFRDTPEFATLLDRCLALAPEQVIATITRSRLRGRGGASFATGLKWQVCRAAAGDERYVICNADEGEPGTFKDRVLLTRSPKDVFLGMVIAAHAIGSRHGILYLRAEYVYLKDYLHRQLQELRDDGLLGRGVPGRPGLDFDIRIQMGAGAYVCGDETALIESCEGNRGTPRLKPPFPVQQGYLGRPTCVNNVETFAAATRIMQEGADWFAAMGTADSAGTRLLSVSGDCSAPGTYEVEWGTTVNEVLAMVGAPDARAVQVSGPSGECVSVVRAGDRAIAYEDLSCSGGFTIFNSQRDLLSVVRDFTGFFAAESCGICVPCRAGTVELVHKVDLVIAGRAGQQDLDEVLAWSELVGRTSRCGLGATAPHPIVTTLASFPEIYQEELTEQRGSLSPSFDLEAALSGYDKAVQQLEGRVAT